MFILQYSSFILPPPQYKPYFYKNIFQYFPKNQESNPNLRF